MVVKSVEKISAGETRGLVLGDEFWGIPSLSLRVRITDVEHARRTDYQPGSDRGRPNHGSTLFSKRIMAQIRSPVRVRTRRPAPWRAPPVGARR